MKNPLAGAASMLKSISLQKIQRKIGLFKEPRLSLRWHTFVYFILFLLAVMSGLFLLLFSTGGFSVGFKECHVFLKNELEHITGNVAQEFGALSVEGVALAESLAEQIERKLKTAGVNPSGLKNHPHLLEPILSEAADRLLTALQKNKCSGVFLILDATVNPALPTAENSRAGLFLKNMEPNVINLTFPTIRFLRGSFAIARQLHLNLLPQWQMEFQVTPGDFFFKTINAATGSVLPLSRLYYWNPCSALVGNYEKAMLLCVPLRTSDGTVIGVCGFEVSAMLFKLKNTPNNSTYTRAFTIFAPLYGDVLNTSKAMYAGNYSALPLQSGGVLSIMSPRKGISSYLSSADGSIYFGLHQKINLYPKNAAFSEEEWALAVLIPNQDLRANIRRQNQLFLVLLFALFIFSVGTALLISRKSVAPVLGALEMVKERKVSGDMKTNIQEIDDLIAFLAAQDATNDDLPGPSKEPIESSALFSAFVKNIKTLSPAERAVFNLYMEGYTAQEIAKILCLSINTIKTHNKRIYTKLNVSSRKELLVYVKMMQEVDGKPDVRQKQ
jgi:RNA polymerase sigma factor (sigma-70 family)